MGKLRRDQLREDKRFAEGKRLILEALAEHQQGLNGIAPPTETFNGLLERASAARGAPLWFPYIGSGLGNGPFVELADGSVKLDLINGIGVHYGHGSLDIVEAALDGACDDLIMQGHLEQNREQILLIEELVEATGIDHCFLTTSGAMAVENGLKLAFQKHAPKRRIIAFENGFHGRTCTLANISDRPQYREGLPANVEVDYLPFHPGNALEALEKCLVKYPSQHAAFILEPIQGEGGIKDAPSEFFLPLLKLLRVHDIAVIADEVQTFGRTTRLLASQALGLMEYIDMVTIGKLGQVCATLFAKRYTPKPGLLSQTFTSSTSAIYASRTILNKLLTSHFGPKGKNQRLHNHLVKGLQKLEPQISGPYGEGLMCAFTLGKGTVEETHPFINKLFQNGVITFSAGQHPVRVRLLLPPCLEEKHLDMALRVIQQTLKEVL